METLLSHQSHLFGRLKGKWHLQRPHFRPARMLVKLVYWRQLFSPYNWFTEQRNSETCIAFLEHLVQPYMGERPLVLVLDIASIIARLVKLPLRCSKMACCRSVYPDEARNSISLTSSGNTSNLRLVLVRSHSAWEDCIKLVVLSLNN